MNPMLPVETLSLIVVALLAASGWLSWKSSSKCGIWRRLSLLGLRLLGIALLSLVAFNPGGWVGGGEDEASAWAVLLDRSASMATKDVEGGSRWERAVKTVKEIRGSLRHPERMKVFTFSSELEGESGKLEGIKPDGRATDIPGSGASLLNASRAAGRRLSGALLLSDGRQTGDSKISDFAIRARSCETPFHPLLIGGAVEERNLSVSASRRQYMAFAGYKLKVGATVSNQGMGGVKCELRLLDSGGAVLGSQALDLSSGERRRVNFELKATKGGYSEYSFEIPRMEGESSGADNKAVIGVNALEKRVKALVVEGLPSWDTKFLVQLLRSQPYIEVCSIYRLSSTRFFKVDTEASKGEESESAIFPDSQQELAAYDVLVFGRGAEYFLNDERVKLVKDALKERGASLLFARGKPCGSKLPALAPLEPVEWGETLDPSFRLKPAPAGQDAGLFGDMLPGLDDPVWARLPTLEKASRCPGVKPFAQILAEGVFEQEGAAAKPFPLLVSQRFGKGMVVAVNAEGFWRWDFTPDDGDSSNMYRELWLELLEWCISCAEFLPGLDYSIRLGETSTFPGEPVRARVVARKPSGAPSVKLNVIRDGKLVRQTLAGACAGEGAWEAVLSFDEPGFYRVEVDGASGGTGLLVKARPGESDKLGADKEFLRQIAEGTGGDMLSESDVPGLLRSLDGDTDIPSLNKSRWRSWWDSWTLLLAILVFLGLEWTIRRRAGLL